MNVISKDGALRIELTNDLEFGLQKIVTEVEHRKARYAEETKLTVSVEVDGIYKRFVPFDQESVAGKLAAAEVEERLRAEPGEFAVTAVRASESYSVRMTLTYEYVLGDCTGKEVADAIRKRVGKLKDYGFTIRKPLIEGEEEESTETED